MVARLTKKGSTACGMYSELELPDVVDVDDTDEVVGALVVDVLVVVDKDEFTPMVKENVPEP